MNWQLFIAGLISVSGALIHGIVGDRIVQSLNVASLPRNPFGNESSTKFLIRVSWHFVTIAFVVLGLGLIAVAIGPRSPAAPGVAYVAGVTMACWGIFGIGAVILRGGGIKTWFRHPAPYLLSAAAILIWWGAASL